MSQPISILHITETGGYGGAESVLLELATRLPRDRYSTSVVLGRNAWLAQKLQEAGIPSHVMKPRRGFDLRPVLGLARLIRRQGVSLVHSHMFRSGVVGCIAARIAGIPSVITYHGVCDIEGTRRRLLARVLGNIASRVVTVSDYLRSALLSSSLTDSKRVVTIRNGVDLGPFATGSDGCRSRVRAELGIGEAPLLGSVGGLRAVKGHEYLIRALPEVMLSEPGVRLLLVGDGPSRGDLERTAQKLGLADRVHFLGFRSDVPRVLNALDCFVLPSLSEGLSIATMEAMAAGLPVIVTDSGGPSELVSDGESGLVVPPGDPQPIAQAVLAVLQDHDIARRLGAAARRRAASFDLNVMVERYDALYREVLSESS